jgi:hypothetical protein
MKLLLGTLILGTAASVFAQEAPVKRQAVLTATAATDVIIGGITKNAPFTAEERGETVKVLADGNRIVQSWTGKMARNSQGKIRREITSGNVGDLGARPFIFGGAAGQPVAVGAGTGDGNRVWTKQSDGDGAGTYTVIAPRGEGENKVSVVTTTENVEEARRVVITKMDSSATPEAVRVSSDAEAVRITLPKQADNSKVQTRKENLGTRDFDGVQADGVRVITTFAAGAVGNEREIEVTSETWFSKELGVVVYSKRTDPRVGESTYQMTNITRAEPDPRLFTNK